MADYTTAALIKSYLGETGSGNDALLALLATAASRWLDRECKRIMYADSDSTRSLDSWEDVDGLYLYLDHDLSSITTVTNGDTVVVASNEYATEPRNDKPYYALKLLASSGKAWESLANGDTENAISVEGKWSYYDTLVEDLAHIAKRLAAWGYRQKDAQVFDTIAIPDAGVIQTPEGFPADAARWVRLHRKLI